jgi:hypothetical protein
MPSPTQLTINQKNTMNPINSFLAFLGFNLSRSFINEINEN